MKVIIWFLWLLPLALIQNHFTFGGIPTALLFSLFIYLASSSSKEWEKQKIIKEAKKVNATPFEYLKDKFPNDILAECEKRRGNKAELEKYLEEQRKDLNIKKVYQEFLLEEFLQGESPIKVAQSRVNSELCGHRAVMKQSNNVTLSNPSNQPAETQDNIPNKTTRVKKIVVHKAKSGQSNIDSPKHPNPCFCRKCGTKLLEASDFCHKCGTKIA